MHELVTKAEFARATQLQKFGLGGVAGPLMRLTGLVKINKMYDHLHTLKGVEFIEAFVREMDIEVEWEGNGLDKIPKEGAFVTVSNHPFGTWDGLILLQQMLHYREDFAVMANFLLQQVEPLQEYFIPVNPLENHQASYSSISGMKRALRHLKEGHPLGLFPAGEVSTFHPKSRAITDRGWQKPALKLIERANVPVIPIYFEGNNSPLFHIMGMIHPALRTVRLPKETLKKKHAKILVKVGSPLSTKEIQRVQGADRLGRYLRARVYSMGSGLEVERFFNKRINLSLSKEKPIAEPTPTEKIARDIAGLREDQKLCSQMEFDVFVAAAPQIPNVLREIGRLREVTFREVGEGTGHATDLDEYDLYYLHLFMWDRENQEIVGAYRLGQGDEIMLKYGKKGFYTFSLFRMKKGLNEHLTRSVELGRSFIQKSYQRKRLSLFLLWKGIHTYLSRSPQYKYLVGPVTISNDYSTLSKGFIVALIERFFFDHELAAHVKPRKRFKPKFKKVNLEDLLEGVDAKNLKQVDRLLEEIEPAHFKLPILLKKYIKQNARIIAFNVDPAFNNALDGLMILDMSELPEATSENMQ